MPRRDLYHDCVRRALVRDVSQDAYEDLFTDPEMLALTAAEDVRLLVFDPVEESIERWIPEWTSAPS